MHQPIQRLKGILSARRVPVILAAVAFTAITPAAPAASLSGSLNTSPTGPVDLTNQGTLDWAVWNYSTNPINGTKTAAPSNRKSGVTPVIGSATTLVGNARGTTSTVPTLTYTYTDGTAFSTLSPAATQGVLFDTSLNDPNAGFTFTITGGQAGVAEVAKLYLTGFSATPKLTVSLPGAADYVDQSVAYPNNARPVSVYTINFTPDNTGDLLTVRYQTSSGSTTNGNVDLQAVAVSPAPVPEPTAACLLVLAGAGGLARRRRHRRCAV
jgi:hypothetical protein